MALSGTLDTFALPDVLRLLASTAKTGRLRITGDRGSGSVWVDNGDVVATELASAVNQDPTDAEVVFGLLRFAVGSFTFEADAAAPQASDALALEPVLGAAENMLVEWRAIEEVIPSLDVWVSLAPDLDGPDVMIDQNRWKGIAAIGSGAQVGAVAEALALNEIDSCRLVKELLELRLVVFIDEPVGLPAPATFEPTPVDADELAPEPVIEADPVAADAATAERGEPEALLDELDAMDDAPTFATDTSFSMDSTFSSDDAFSPDPISQDTGSHDTHTEPSLASLSASEDAIDPLLSVGDPLGDFAAPDAPAFPQSAAPEGDDIFGAAPSAPTGDDELDPAEMARQLANLSPKAAKAVAAAAKATTDAEREEALAAVEAEDDTVNRGLLLKFLGSVDS